MNIELNGLNDRLERLERENKRLKLWGGIAAGGLLCIGLFGFAAPVVCDIVTGERLVIRDTNGRQRVGIDAYRSSAPGLTLNDSNGRERAKLGLNDKGDVTLSFTDEKGGAKASYLFAAEGAPKEDGPKTGDCKEKKNDPSMASEESLR
jgi:hypothetical protein